MHIQNGKVGGIDGIVREMVNGGGEAAVEWTWEKCV